MEVNGSYKSSFHVTTIINSNILDCTSVFLKKRESGSNLEHLPVSPHYLKYSFSAFLWNNKILPLLWSNKE